jgi:protocatechuate 3,4-dioxygenase beta subunit
VRHVSADARLALGFEGLTDRMAAPSLPPEGHSRSDRDRPATSRRRFLQAGGVTAVGLALAACATETTTGSAASSTSSTGRATTTTGGTGGDGVESATGTGSTTTPVAAAALTVADFDGLTTCVLLPEMTAGPFPLDEQFDRRDITEDSDGQPMRLGFRVVDDTCTAVPGTKVEIWHCDATGDYSAFTDGGGGKDDGEGTTFLRGTQGADDDGIVEFLTIVPGWYRGRAVHIHLRVHVDDATVLTSQVFFDASYLEDVYATEPYAQFGPPDTSNEEDGIAGDVESNGTLLTTTAAETTAGPGTLALVNLGIR